MSTRTGVLVLAGLLLIGGCNREDDKGVSGITIAPPTGTGETPGVPSSTVVNSTVVKETTKPEVDIPEVKATVVRDTVKPASPATIPAVEKAMSDEDALAKAGLILAEAKDAIDTMKIDVATTKLKSIEAIKSKLSAEKRSQFLRYQDQLESAKAIKAHHPELGN